MNNIDALVYQYRDSDDPKERNRLFIQIADVYRPRMYKVMAETEPRYKDEVLSIYYEFVLRAIERWRGDALFTTYLYSWTGIKLKSTVYERYIYKDNREPSFEKMFEEYDDGEDVY